MNSDIRLAVSFRGHRKRKRLRLLLGSGSTDLPGGVRPWRSPPTCKSTIKLNSSIFAHLHNQHVFLLTLQH